MNFARKTKKGKHQERPAGGSFAGKKKPSRKRRLQFISAPNHVRISTWIKWYKFVERWRRWRRWQQPHYSCGADSNENTYACIVPHIPISHLVYSCRVARVCANITKQKLSVHERWTEKILFEKRKQKKGRKRKYVQRNVDGTAQHSTAQMRSNRLYLAVTFRCDIFLCRMNICVHTTHSQSNVAAYLCCLHMCDRV